MHQTIHFNAKVLPFLRKGSTDINKNIYELNSIKVFLITSYPFKRVL